MHRWMTVAVAATMAAGAMAQTAPGSMTVATFLSKADALGDKGLMAMFSPDIALLKNEVAFAGRTYRQQLQAEAEGGQPSSCPPTRASLNSDDVIAQMKTYPMGNRQHVTVSTAVADLFRKRYPCRPARR